MTTQHTAGPWTVGKNAENNGTIPIVANEYRVGGASLIVEAKRGSAWNAEDHERDANARLIAAAPDLLELAKDVARHYTGTDSRFGRKARAAIAKATGDA